MTPKDKPKRGGAKPFQRATKPGSEARGKAPGKPAFSAKAGLNPREPKAPRGDEKPAARPPARVAAAQVDAAVSKPERISKILARVGVASRRDIERMIMEGRVRLNGVVLETPVVNVTLEDRIEVDGEPIRGIERTRLWLYHKPAGLVTTNSDPEGRPTVFENLPEDLPRVLSIGRLDINTEGLLLLTNDGGLSRVLELPTTGWLRRYRVRAHGEVDQAALDKLKEGIAVDGVLYGAIDATLDRQQGHNVWITVGLREGKNREVKNVLGALGLEVNRLIRISYGPFQLGDLPEGQVVEVRGRMLRDQLGPRLIEEAKANFDAPIYKETAGEEPEAATTRPAAREDKPRTGGWSREHPASRQDGRREDRGARSGSGSGPRDDRGSGEKPKKRPPMGTSRTANVWMAPGARPTTDAKGKRSSARAEAEKLFDKPKAPEDRRVVVNRAAEDSDWIRAETPARDDRGDDGRRNRPTGDRPTGDRPRRGEFSRGEREFSGRPRGERSFSDKPRGDRKPREEGDRPRGRAFSDDARSDRPRGDRPGGDRPRGDRPFGDRPRGPRADGDQARGDRPRGDRPHGDHPRGDRPQRDRPAGDRSFAGRPSDGKPGGGKPFGGKPGGGKSFGGKPGGGKSFGGKPGGGKSFGGKPGGGKPAGGRGKPGGGAGRPGGRPAGGKPRTRG